MTAPTALVYGVAVAGEATARGLAAHGYRVLLADDAPSDERRAVAHRLGTELIECPDSDAIDRLLGEVDLVSPAPGVPETHLLVRAALARDVPLRTEIDLAYEWEQQRPGGPRPMLAVTGTDGKTTTTMLLAALLTAAGLPASAVGNTEVPLVDALDDPVDAFAVECSSFRLSWIRAFRADAAIWLNLAPDHQNWHQSMATYEQAKANIWRHQRSADVAIGWADDPVVMRHLAAAPGRHRTYGPPHADYLVIGTGDERMLCGPSGMIAPVSALRRQFPHDIANALAAVAACVESGLVRPDQIEAGLASFRTPPHRIEPLGTLDGVAWYNDSKATSPHAALTAIRSFESIVLIAGGRNKGLDLASLASETARMRAVVAIGEAADEVASAFAGRRTVVRADSMDDAVAAARHLAQAGDVVLLSPACASFDWYPGGGYPARGEDFRRAFQTLCEGVGS
jgi:UDP-N-acetylmuramoylalanine--D-glutamate ligase